MLRRALATHPDVTDLGEIMHPDYSRGFYRNLSDRMANNISDGVHTNWMAILLDTIAILTRDGPETQRYIIDIKYNMALSFGMHLYHGTLTNLFTSTLHEKNCKIVQVVRQNKLDLIVSERMAMMTNQWELSSQQEQKAGTVHINPITLHERIRNEAALDQLFRDQIKDIPDTYEVIYEKLFLETGDINPAPLDQIARLLELEPQFDLKPKLTKQARPLSESIRNFKQVRQAIGILVRDRYLPAFYEDGFSEPEDRAEGGA